jgi:hypothetical protein
VFDVGLVMDAVVGQGTTEPFEHDHGDREARCHGIIVTSISGELDPRQLDGRRFPSASAEGSHAGATTRRARPFNDITAEREVSWCKVGLVLIVSGAKSAQACPCKK